MRFYTFIFLHKGIRTKQTYIQSNGIKVKKLRWKDRKLYLLRTTSISRAYAPSFPLLFCSFVDICTCYIVYAPFASSTGQWFTRTAKNFEGKIAPHSSLLERRPNVVRKRHTTAVEKFNRIRASDHLTN